MADEHSEKIVRLLEEIRDLTKERNEKLETLIQTTRQRAEDALHRQKEAQERLLSQRGRFLWTLTPLLLLAIGSVAYLGFWVIPKSEQRQMERQMEERRMMQSNYLSATLSMTRAWSTKAQRSVSTRVLPHGIRLQFVSRPCLASC